MNLILQDEQKIKAKHPKICETFEPIFLEVFKKESWPTYYFSMTPYFPDLFYNKYVSFLKRENQPFHQNLAIFKYIRHIGISIFEQVFIHLERI